MNVFRPRFTRALLDVPDHVLLELSLMYHLLQHALNTWMHYIVKSSPRKKMNELLIIATKVI